MTMQSVTMLFALSLASAVAFAQSPPDSLRACAALNSDRARLKCYDDAMAALGVARAAKEGAPSSASAAAQVATSSAPATSKSAARSVAPEDFGLDATTLRKQRGEADPASTPPPQLVARVKSVGRRARGELSIELDNGQIWAETQRRAGASVSVGDTVAIRPGTLGSYFLSTHAGYALRVTRIQ